MLPESIPLGPGVAAVAERYGLDPALVQAVIEVESGEDASAVSSRGAQGLMQVLPETAAWLGFPESADPAVSLEAGCHYLRALLDSFGGDVELALAAYNAGPGAVERYGQQVPPYRETRDYVQKIKGRTGRLSPAARPFVLYRTVDTVDGRPVPRYTNVRPASGEYEVVRSAN